MPKNLVIVESPAKAKTIEGYLGGDFVVRSSMGHVRDLPKGDKAIDIGNNFRPSYEITEDKKSVVKELQALARKCDQVYLATDDDREGEAISWHLAEALGLDLENTPRIVFREITKGAIQRALQSPRRIDQDLVNAQQARRVLDRLVGFELSPILWRKIRGGLSAGRVQSVAVRIVVEREREIEQHQARGFFRITGRFATPSGATFMARLDKDLTTEAAALNLLERCIGARYSVASLEVKPLKRSPAAPFTTSTLQQEASRKLGYSVSQTMQLAQKLYESGKISYMRTDSINLSEEALAAAGQAINGRYGPEFHQLRRYKTKNESAQEAHEAIRPTDFSQPTLASGEARERKLYELIWRRAIASQMTDARLERTVAQIAIEGQPEKLTATGDVTRFEGFLKVYVESSDVEVDESAEGGEGEGGSSMLPPLTEGEPLEERGLLAREKFTRAAPRYTEASLVRRLEELGIGRPSTYAPTISTILKREYIVKESREGHPRSFTELTLEKGQIRHAVRTEQAGAERNKLFPTDMGRIVNDFLVAYFPTVVDYKFTAKVEKQFDEIAQGQTEWAEMIARFYEDFHPTVAEAQSVERTAVNNQRELGLHPQTGKPVTVRLGRFGPMVQIGTADDPEKPTFASLRKDQRLDSITLEEALDLFKLPRVIGEHEGKPITAAIGRFGPYVKYEGKFASLTKEDNPLEITLSRALELIAAKAQAEADRLIKSFDEDAQTTIIKGRFGPYVVHQGRNLKIPKDQDPTTVTYEQILKMAEEQPVKQARGGRGKAAPAAATKAPKSKAGAARKVASAIGAKKSSTTTTPKKSATGATKKATTKPARATGAKAKSAGATKTPRAKKS